MNIKGLNAKQKFFGKSKNCNEKINKARESIISSIYEACYLVKTTIRPIKDRIWICDKINANKKINKIVPCFNI